MTQRRSLHPRRWVATLLFFRRTIQMLFLLLLLSAPLYQIVRTFRQDPYPYPESPVIHFAFLRTFLQNYDHTIRNLLGTFFTNISGGPYSLKFFSIKIVEPFTAFLNAVRNSFSPDVWTATMFLSFSLPLLAVFLFGRFYCGYICPMSLFVSENLRLQQRFLGRIPSSSASPEHLSSRFLLLFALPLFLLLLFRPSFLQFLLLPALLQNAWSDFVLFGGFSLWSLLLLLVFVFEILFPGTFCRRLCPTGLFLGQAGRYRLFRLGYQRGISCIGSCTVCNEVCWLGLEPKTRAEDPACDLCMRCAGQCPQGRLKLFLPLSLILILLFPSPNASASEWDERTAYDLSVTLLPLAEGRLSVLDPRDSTPWEFYYSFAASPRVRDRGGTMECYVHIRKNDTGSYGPLHVRFLRNDTPIRSLILSDVNYPISIGSPSVYRFLLPFDRNTDYSLLLRPGASASLSVRIRFRYPPRRF